MASKTEQIANYLGSLFHEFRCDNKEDEDQDEEFNIADALQKVHNEFELALPSGRDFKTFSLYNVKPGDIEVFMVGNDVKIRATSVGPMTGYGYRTSKTTSYNFSLPENADKSSLKSSFDIKRGVLKIEWGYKQGIEVPDEPEPEPEPEDDPETPKHNVNGLQSLVGKARKGTYRFSPIRPKLKRKKRPAADQPTLDLPEIEPEVPEGPNAEDLKADIIKQLEKCEDVEKLEEILNMLE